MRQPNASTFVLLLIGIASLGLGIYFAKTNSQSASNTNQVTGNYSPTSTGSPIPRSSVNLNAPVPPAPPRKSDHVAVPGNKLWTATNIKIQKGSPIHIVASGGVNVASHNSDSTNRLVGPDGWGFIPSLMCDGAPCGYVYTLNTSLGCLMGKIGNDGEPFQVGSDYTFVADRSGALYFGVNDAIGQAATGTWADPSAVSFTDNTGTFYVLVLLDGK